MERSISTIFGKFADKASKWTGSVYAFVFSLLLIGGWVAAGPLYDWSDSHSLFINTVTTCITYMMVFIIQSTQNKDTKAIQLKLDELIRSSNHADTKMIDLESLSERDLEEIHKRFVEMKND